MTSTAVDLAPPPARTPPDGKPAATVAGIAPPPWLDHLVKHLPVAGTGVDPEGVHQVRVACARLLVWLDLGGCRLLRDDLRRLRDHAARMRDLDVLRAEDPSELARRVGRRGRGRRVQRGRVKALHRGRRAVRRLRFALEWTGMEVPPIVELQEALGAVCDHAMARRRLDAAEASTESGARRRAELERALRRSRRHARRVWRKTRPALKALRRRSARRGLCRRAGGRDELGDRAFDGNRLSPSDRGGAGADRA